MMSSIEAHQDHGGGGTMLPSRGWPRALFWCLMIVTGVVLVHSIAMSIWSQLAEEGWVSIAVMALLSWCLTAPLLLASLVWLVVLVVRILRRRFRGALETG